MMFLFFKWFSSMAVHLFPVRGRKRWGSPARPAKQLAKKMRGREAPTRPGKLHQNGTRVSENSSNFTIDALIVLILTSIPYSLAHEAEDLGDPSLPSLVVCIAACPARADASRPLMPVARIRNAQEREVTAHVVLPMPSRWSSSKRPIHAHPLHQNIVWEACSLASPTEPSSPYIKLVIGLLLVSSRSSHCDEYATPLYQHHGRVPRFAGEFGAQIQAILSTSPL